LVVDNYPLTQLARLKKTMETFLQDLRYGLRMLRKGPAFTVVAVLTLALGIGANTAIFSLINAVILSTLPVKRAIELVVVGDPSLVNNLSQGTPDPNHFSYPLYRELRDHNSVFSGLIASGTRHGTKVESEGSGLITESANAALVTGNYFSVLGVEAARKAFASFDPNVPVTGARTVEDQVSRSLRQDILIARLSSFFGALALLLACVGLYGVMSYTVGGRTKEFGLRMALGAQRPAVLWMVLREVLKLVLIGVLIGVPAALAASQFLQSTLFGLKATDPASMAAVVVVLAVVALIAGLIPARRATKVDPMVALRYE
jgi:FtsX-like permease family/MacB-like periplasmic core domain